MRLRAGEVAKGPYTTLLDEGEANFPRPNHTYNKHHTSNIKICALLYVHITTGTLVLTRLHNKADLLETKVNCAKDRKVHADENKLCPGKEWMP